MSDSRNASFSYLYCKNIRGGYYTHSYVYRDATTLTAKSITIGGPSKSWIVRVLRSITENRSASASVPSQQSSQYVRPCSRVWLTLLDLFLASDGCTGFFGPAYRYEFSCKTASKSLIVPRVMKQNPAYAQ
ncbi:hypothetical protein K474DRAFT_1657529 [Panus rudis PR-1116 ss-1]|nr:hypothetical protein K474DRAFT_1657529 [Panus rudis PR-1116 ss-1]